MWRRRRKLDGDPTEIFQGLRSQLFQLDAAAIGLKPSGELAHVWAGMMELDVGGDTASIVAVADGSTSMYLSTGGGVIGGGAYEPVVEANRRFLAALEHNLAALESEGDPAVPGAGAVRFRALTYEGRRFAEASEAELASGSHALSGLYAAGHDVITALRIAEQSHDDP